MNRKKEITISILGDICPSFAFKEVKNISDISLFNDITDVLKKSDYVVANLESPLTNYETKLDKNSINIKSDPIFAKLFKESGINAVSLANNHILDYEQIGLKDTIENLKQNDIQHYGIGKKEEAYKPLIVEIKNKKIGFMAFAEREFNTNLDYEVGADVWDDLDSIKAISLSKKNCDYLIIQYHGGIEHYKYPSPILQKKCRAMADAGADFITCQHSHCIGTREEWNGSEILYGQGNSIFGFEKNNRMWNEGLIVQITIDNDIEIEYIPIEAIEKGEFLSNNKNVLLDFYNESKKIIDKEFVDKEWKKFANTLKNSYLPMLFGKGRITNKLNRISDGLIINLFTQRNSKRNAMNLVRCDAHKEVVQSILESEIYDKK